MSRIFSVWNQLDGWLRQVEMLRRAASAVSDATTRRAYLERIPARRRERVDARLTAPHRDA